MKKFWVKVSLAISLDGKLAFPNIRDKELAGKQDRRILEESLAWADATLMGGETLRVHGNTCLIHNNKLINKRLQEGKRSQPISIIVSNKVNHEKELSFFNQPVERWLITKLKLSEQTYKEAGYFNLVNLQEKWSNTLNDLKKSGLNHLLILGGAKLISSIIKEDQIDELQFTLTPKILGGINNWIPNNVENLSENLSQNNSWLLKRSEILENNEISLKYIRNRLSIKEYLKDA